MLLNIHNLKTYFYTEQRIVRAVDGVSLKVDKGSTLGLVGESACGKSVTALSMMKLILHPGKIISGEINFQGENILKNDEKQMCRIRGNEISMIFQSPVTSLNPVLTIGHQIAEAIILHQGLKKREAKEKAIEILHKVRIPLPKDRFCNYPYELSGGMCQRVMIAIALSCSPRLLICDEPTTALDVTIQAQILKLINDLREELGSSIIFITHNLGIIAECVEKVAIMYWGKIVEEADVFTLFKHPLHPYTLGLLNSIPRLDKTQSQLREIPGVIPSFRAIPEGCRFYPRCKISMPICKESEPELKEIFSGHRVRCWKV